MQKIQLSIVALANSESHPGNYILMLEEQKGSRRLPVVIGAFEAQAIAIALERMQPTRPLTHDLFKNTLDQLKFSVKEVMISALLEGVFYATIRGTDASGKEQEIDARTSDAIALAVRFRSAIFTTESILEEAGISVSETAKAKFKRKGNLEEYTLEELDEILQQVLAKEDYERAAKIRDIIEKKKKSGTN